MTNSVSGGSTRWGSKILFAAIAADLLPHPVVENADFDNDRAFLMSGDYRYSIKRTGGSYTVCDHIEFPVFSLGHVSLGTAIEGAIELLRADRLRDAYRIPASVRARELNSLKIYAARARDEDTLVLSRKCPSGSSQILGFARSRSAPFAEHVAIASRNAEAPWLWDVLSGDLGSDAFPVPLVMSWEDLKAAAAECAI